MRYPHSSYPLGNDYPSRETAETAASLAEAIGLTAEICGHLVSPAAARLMAQDLAPFDPAHVMAALARCRLEVQGALTLSSIVMRIDDGRPEVDIAWDMLPRSESESVVWTNEIVLAWSAALPRLVEDDEVGAQKTFEQAYRKAVMEARMRREPVRWIPSLGSDVGGRRRTLLDAVEQHRLTIEHIAPLLPDDVMDELMPELSASIH